MTCARVRGRTARSARAARDRPSQPLNALRAMALAIALSISSHGCTSKICSLCLFSLPLKRSQGNPSCVGLAALRLYREWERLFRTPIVPKLPTSKNGRVRYWLAGHPACCLRKRPDKKVPGHRRHWQDVQGRIHLSAFWSQSSRNFQYFAPICAFRNNHRASSDGELLHLSQAVSSEELTDDADEYHPRQHDQDHLQRGGEAAQGNQQCRRAGWRV